MLLKGEALKRVALAQLVNLMFSLVLLEVVSFSQYFLPVCLELRHQTHSFNM